MLRVFPGAQKVQPKTQRPGGGYRHRWRDSDGNIYEWGYKDGTAEKNNARGLHVGEFDAQNGSQLRPPNGRRIEP